MLPPGGEAPELRMPLTLNLLTSPTFGRSLYATQPHEKQSIDDATQNRKTYTDLFYLQGEK